MRSLVTLAALVVLAVVAAPSSAGALRNQGALVTGPFLATFTKVATGHSLTRNLSGRGQFICHPSASQRSYSAATSTSS
jgi:hypothetical protein